MAIVVAPVKSMAPLYGAPAVDIPNPFEGLNPLNWLADSMREGRNFIVQDVEASIGQSPRVSSNPTIIQLYELTLAPTGRFAWVIVLFAVVMAVLTFKAAGRVVYALVVMFVVVAAAPSYIYLLNELASLGDSLNDVARGMLTTKMPKDLESTGNILVDIGSFGAVFATGLGVVSAFKSSYVMYVLSGLLLPIAFSVSALGPRTRNVFNALASITLVLAFIGRPIAILVIELFMGIGFLQPGAKDVASQNMVTAVGFLLALLVQVLAMVVMFVGIKQVQGAINTRIGQIRSNLKTAITNIVRIRKENPNKQISKPIPVVVMTPKPSATTVAKNEVKSIAVTATINLAAIGATAATGNPAVGAGVKTAGHTVNRKINHR